MLNGAQNPWIRVPRYRRRPSRWQPRNRRYARYGYYQARIDFDRKLKNHIRQIHALGFDVTITRAA